MNQDPIGLWGGDNLYQFASNAQIWIFVKILEPAGDCKAGLYEPE